MNRLKLLFVGIMLATVWPVLAQSKTYYSNASGNWNSASSWSTIGFGDVTNTNTGTFPVAGDIVNIGGGINISLTANQACASITFQTGATANNILDFDDAFTLTVSGAITIPKANSGTNWLDVGTGTLNAGSVSFTDGTATVGNLHRLTASSGTITVTGNVTGTGVSGLISITDVGILRLGGAMFVSALPSPATPATGTITTVIGSTVEYNGASAQTVQAFNYGGHVVLSGGAKSMLGGVEINVGGNLSIANGTSYTIGANNITVNGTTTVGGGSSGSIVFSSSAGNKFFIGLVTVNSGASWIENQNAAFSFSGGITNNGTFTAFVPAGATFPSVHSFLTSQILTGNFSIPRISIPQPITLTTNGSLTSSFLISITPQNASLVNNGILNADSLIIGNSNINFTNNATASIVHCSLSANSSSIINTGSLTISGVTSATGTFTGTSVGNTVSYTGAAQNVFRGDYYNLNLSGSGAKTFTATTVNISGNLAIGGTATVSGTGTTLNLNGTTQNISGVATLLATNIQLTGSGTKTFGTPISVASTFTIGNGTKAGLSSSSAYTAATLIINGGLQAAGFYGSNTSITAVHKSDNFFAGDGYINITSGTARTYYSIASTNWVTPATWSTVGFGYSENFGSYPVAGDAVVMGSNVSVVMNASHACESVTYDLATTGTSSLDLSAGVLTVTNITIARPTSGAGTNLFNVGTGVLNATNITYTGGGSGAHRLAIGDGTANISGTVTSSGVSSEFLFTDNGNLNLQGTFFANGTFTPAVGCTVTYLGGIQTIRPVTYHHLVLSGGAKSSAAGTINVNGDLTIADNAMFTLGDVNLNVLGETVVGSGTGGGISFTSTQGVKYFEGLITLNIGSTWTATTESFRFVGGITNFGTFTPGTGIYGFEAESQSISGISSIPNLTYNTPGNLVTLTINGSLSVDNLAVNGASHSITNNGTLTINNTISGSGSIIQNAATTLTTTASGTLSQGINAAALGNTVSYTGAAQTVLGGNYHHLNLGGSGVKTMQATTTAIDGDFNMTGTVSSTAAAGITFSGNVDIGTGTSFSLGYFTHSVLANWTVGGTMTGAGSTVNMNSSNQNIDISNAGASKFNNLTLSNSGTKTFVNTVDIDGTMTVDNGVVVDLGSSTNHTTGTLIINGEVKLQGTHGNQTADPDPTYIDNIYFAASPGIITVESLVYYSRQSGNWNSTTTWSNTGHTGLDGSTIPGNGSVVFIGGDDIVTVTTNSSCATLSFTQGTNENNTLVVNNAVTVTIAGSVTIPRQASGGVNSINVGAGGLTTGNIFFTNSNAGSGHRIDISTGTLIVNGSVSGLGTSNAIDISSSGLFRLYGSLYSATLGTLTMVSNSTMEYAGGSQTVSTRGYAGNLLISGTGLKSYALGNSGKTIGGNLTINSGTSLDVSGNVPLTVIGTTNISGSVSIAGVADRTFTGDVTVSSGANWTETSFGQINFGGSFNFNGNTYTSGLGVHQFSGTSESIGGVGKTLSIPNLTINGTYTGLGTLTVGSALAGTGTLTMISGSALNIGGIADLLNLNASANGTTVNYNGSTGQTLIIPTGGQYQNLLFNNTTATGIATPALSNQTIYVGGNLTNNGAVAVGGFQGFNSNNATIIFNGSTQTLSGSAPTVFHNLTINPSTSVSFQSNTTINGAVNMLTGTLNNTAALTLGNNVTLTRNAASTYSGNTPLSGTAPLGNHYNLVYTGTGSISTGPEVQGSHVKDVTIGLTGTLTQANAMNLYGILSLNSGATYDPGNSLLTVKSHNDTGVDAGGSIGTIPAGATFTTNPVKVERYLRTIDNRDHFISTPVTNATIAQLQAAFPVTGKFDGSSYSCSGCLNNGASLRWYKESVTGVLNKGYQGYPKTNNLATLTPGVGYDVWMWDGGTPETIVYNGPINQGNINGIGTDIATGQVLSRTENSGSASANANGWNLVGNPYPAPVRWTGSNSGGWTLTNIVPVAWAWDVNAGTWVMIDAGDDIAIGQAFWVQVPSGQTSGTINITEAAKSPARSGAYYREQNTESMLKVNLSNGVVTESAFIVPRSGATAHYNWQIDFEKIEMGIESMHMTLVKENQNLGYYAYQSNMETDIPIRIVAEEEGLYELSFEELGGFPSLTDYFLLDMVSQERMPFSTSLKYTFTYSKKDTKHRFALTKVGGDMPGNQYKVQLYPNPTSGLVSLAINSTSPVRDVVLQTSAGQVLNTNLLKEKNGQIELSLAEYPSGIYLLKVVLDEGVVVKRVVKN